MVSTNERVMEKFPCKQTSANRSLTLVCWLTGLWGIRGGSSRDFLVRVHINLTSPEWSSSRCQTFWQSPSGCRWLQWSRLFFQRGAAGTCKAETKNQEGCVWIRVFPAFRAMSTRTHTPGARASLQFIIYLSSCDEILWPQTSLDGVKESSRRSSSWFRKCCSEINVDIFSIQKHFKLYFL